MVGKRLNDGLFQARVGAVNSSVPYTFTYTNGDTENAVIKGLPNDINIGDIVECTWKKKSNIFKYYGKRLDKEKPNHYTTVNSVIDAIRDPINLGLLRLVYKSGGPVPLFGKYRGKKQHQLPKRMREVLDQLGPQFRIRCLLVRDPYFIFNTDDQHRLRNIFKRAIQENLELESRLIFPNNKLPYISCLLNKIYHEPPQTTPVLKVNGSNGNRLSYAILGNS